MVQTSDILKHAEDNQLLDMLHPQVREKVESKLNATNNIAISSLVLVHEAGNEQIKQAAGDDLKTYVKDAIIKEIASGKAIVIDSDQLLAHVNDSQAEKNAALKAEIEKNGRSAETDTKTALLERNQEKIDALSAFLNERAVVIDDHQYALVSNTIQAVDNVQSVGTVDSIHAFRQLLPTGYDYAPTLTATQYVNDIDPAIFAEYAATQVQTNDAASLAKIIPHQHLEEIVPLEKQAQNAWDNLVTKASREVQNENGYVHADVYVACAELGSFLHADIRRELIFAYPDTVETPEDRKAFNETIINFFKEGYEIGERPKHGMVTEYFNEVQVTPIGDGSTGAVKLLEALRHKDANGKEIVAERPVVEEYSMYSPKVEDYKDPLAEIRKQEADAVRAETDPKARVALEEQFNEKWAAITRGALKKRSIPLASKASEAKQNEPANPSEENGKALNGHNFAGAELKKLKPENLKFHSVQKQDETFSTRKLQGDGRIPGK